MANKEMTRAQALVFAIDTIREYEGECEAITVLEKMHMHRGYASARE